MTAPARTAAALLLCAPVAALAVDRGGAGAALALALLAAAPLLGRGDAVRTWCAAVGLSFAVPLVPVVAQVLPFQAERVVVLGALAFLAVNGELRPSPGASRGARFARGLLLALAAFTAAGALRGFLVSLPDDAPWVGHMLAVAGRDLLVLRSPVEATHALAVGGLRLEALLLAWAGLELALRRPELPRVLVGWLAAGVLAGLVVGAAEFVTAALWRGESLAARLAAPLGRNHRPLTDHNALGSALVLLAPVLAARPLAWLAARARREPGPPLGGALLALAALPAAAFLLVASRSKAGLLGAALALALLPLLAFGARRVLRRPLAWGSLAAVALLLVVVQALPAKVAGNIAAQHRYAEDAIRALRFDAAVAYLRRNRSAPWIGALSMVEERPLLGQGLGTFPRRLADHRFEGRRVEGRRVEFDPLHENAHNQWLQHAAEEGALGLALALLALGAAAAGASRLGPGVDRDRRVPPPERFEAVAWTAGLVGLFVNLQVGHSLLEPTPAHLHAAALAVGFAGLARGIARSGDDGTARSGAPARRPVLPLAGGLAALALLPAAWQPRPPLDGFAFGCFPWDEDPRSATGRDRVLAPDARWVQRWGDGERMLLLARDVRPGHFEGVQTVEGFVAGERALGPKPLEHTTDPARANPTTWLGFDPPRPVAPGTLVEVRLVADPRWSETLMFSTGRTLVGPRVSDALFRDRGAGR